jgi:hypothetical protein
MRKLIILVLADVVVCLSSSMASSSETMPEAKCRDLGEKFDKVVGKQSSGEVLLTPAQFESALALFQSLSSNSVKAAVSEFEKATTGDSIATYLSVAGDCAFLRLKFASALVRSKVNVDRKSKIRAAVRGNILEEHFPTLMNAAVDIAIIERGNGSHCWKVDQNSLDALSKESKTARDRSKEKWDGLTAKLASTKNGAIDAKTNADLKIEIKREMADYERLRPRIIELAKKID